MKCGTSPLGSFAFMKLLYFLCYNIENPIAQELQEYNRYRFWGKIEELDGKILRVVTLEDKKTIHNAFPDRRFKR